MATAALLSPARERTARLAVVALIGLVIAGSAAAQQPCGSALLAEATAPAVFQGITLAGSTARMWLAGSGQVYSASPCSTGCLGLVASPLCEEGGDCIAITGVNWLGSGSCTSAGQRPGRTVLVVEAPTVADGGRWVALNLAANASDANTDLDAAAEALCGPSCFSQASPLIGGEQAISVLRASLTGDVLTLRLGWSGPAGAAEALNDSGSSLVSSFGLYSARSSAGVPPPATGAKSGFTRADDTDVMRVGGFSTDTSATIAVDTQGSGESVFVAIGLAFDGSGDPLADASTRESTVVSRPALVYTPGAPAASVSSISPESGPPVGGTPVVVHGSGFVAGAALVFDGLPAVDVAVVDSATITATTPAHPVGVAEVVVTNPAALSGVLTPGFTYVDDACHLVLSEMTLSGAHEYTSCGTISLGPALTIATGATVSLTAASHVVLRNGTSVAAGASLTVALGS